MNFQVSGQIAKMLKEEGDNVKADYKAAVAQRGFAKNQLDYTKLYAPEDGTITVRVQENGATVTKGQPVYTMAKTKPIWIRAYVNETDCCQQLNTVNLYYNFNLKPCK